MSSTSAINSLLSSTANDATSTTQANSAIDLSNMLAAESGTSTPGIDVNAAVEAAIYADRAPERVWQADQTTLSSQTSALTAIQTATESLQNDLQSLNTLTGPLAARTVSSSNSNYVTATAATGTAAGTHSVEVSALATQGSWYSDLESSPTATLPTSSMTITTTSGATATFATGSGNAGDTLNDLASAINADTSLGVTATVMTDSTGSRLAIVSNSAGAANDFSVSAQNFTGTSWTSPDLAPGQTLGINAITLTTSAGTATINTASGETYAQLASAINSAEVYQTTTGFTSSQSSLSSSTALTAGSVTTIDDSATGQTFTFTASAGDTVATLNNAIAAAVSAGTLSTRVTGAISQGSEVISEASGDQGITVSTNDAVLGGMNASAGTGGVPLGLTATAGSDSGGSNITISGNDGSSFTINEPVFGFTQANAATDATGTIDGVPFDSASNTVSGVIPGVTLDLLGATEGAPISLSIAPDASQISTALNQFVTDYNSTINLVTAQFTMTSGTDSSGNTTSSEGVLASDSTVVSLQSALEQALGYTYTQSSGTTTVSSLADLGVTMNDDGTLSLDTETLDNALTTNAGDVQRFLQGSALNGFANNFYSSLNAYTGPADGAFQVDLNSISAQNNDLSSEISDFEANYIAGQQTILTQEFSAAEEALQSLPEQMQQLNAELGFNNNSSNG
jgi:flagellar hook-associated protein 2